MNKTLPRAAVALLGLAAVVVWHGPADAQPPDPRPRLQEILAGEVTSFVLVDIDVEGLATSLRAGTANMPFVDSQGTLHQLVVAAKPAGLRAPGLTTGTVKADGGAEKVPLPPEEAYRLGDCGSSSVCGSATILDEAHTMASGLVLSKAGGVSWYEPVNLLLGTEEFPGLHVVYNDVATVDRVIDDENAFCDLRDDRCPQPEGLDAEPDPEDQVVAVSVEGATNIVLDSDRVYRNENPATVFQRQLAVFNDLTVMYEFIEPLSSENPEVFRWKLDLTVKGQETWASGGPTTTDSTDLIDELTDPGYPLLNSVTATEVHLFLVGYDVDGVWGRAAGIGTARGGLGGAPGNNHAFAEARRVLPAKTKWVIAAHEVGHLIGGAHGAGATNSCSFFLSAIPICGTSIMAAGSAGSIHRRAEYFTDANDRKIYSVISTHL